MNDTMLRKLDGKKLRVKLKHGASLEELLEYFNCNEEQLEEFLEKNFTPKAKKNIMAELRKNQKKKDQQKCVASKKKKIKVVTKEKEKLETMQKETSIEDYKKILRNEEQELADTIFKEEKKHASLISERKNLKEKLVEQRNCMIELERLIEEREKELQGVLKQLESVSDKIFCSKQKIKQDRENLKNVRNDLKELEKVEIFVYEKGEIEMENYSEENIPQQPFNKEVFSNLCSNEASDNLSIKQIKQIMKLIDIVKFFNSKGMLYEMTFESSEVQKLFKEQYC